MSKEAPITSVGASNRSAGPPDGHSRGCSRTVETSSGSAAGSGWCLGASNGSVGASKVSIGASSSAVGAFSRSVEACI